MVQTNKTFMIVFHRMDETTPMVEFFEALSYGGSERFFYNKYNINDYNIIQILRTVTHEQLIPNQI